MKKLLLIFSFLISIPLAANQLILKETEIESFCSGNPVCVADGMGGFFIDGYTPWDTGKGVFWTQQGYSYDMDSKMVQNADGHGVQFFDFEDPHNFFYRPTYQYYVTEIAGSTDRQKDLKFNIQVLKTQLKAAKAAKNTAAVNALVEQILEKQAELAYEKAWATELRAKHKKDKFYLSGQQKEERKALQIELANARLVERESFKAEKLALKTQQLTEKTDLKAIYDTQYQAKKTQYDQIRATEKATNDNYRAQISDKYLRLDILKNQLASNVISYTEYNTERNKTSTELETLKSQQSAFLSEMAVQKGQVKIQMDQIKMTKTAQLYMQKESHRVQKENLKISQTNTRAQRVLDHKEQRALMTQSHRNQRSMVEISQ